MKLIRKSILASFILAACASFAEEASKVIYSVTDITCPADGGNGVNWEKIIGPTLATPAGLPPSGGNIRYIDAETLDEVLSFIKNSPGVTVMQRSAVDNSRSETTTNHFVQHGGSMIELKQGDALRVSTLDGKTQLLRTKYSFSGVDQKEESVAIYVDLSGNRIAAIQFPVESATVTVPNPSFWSWLPWNPSTVDQTVKTQKVLFITKR